MYRVFTSDSSIALSPTSSVRRPSTVLIVANDCLPVPTTLPSASSIPARTETRADGKKTGWERAPRRKPSRNQHAGKLTARRSCNEFAVARTRANLRTMTTFSLFLPFVVARARRSCPCRGRSGRASFISQTFNGISLCALGEREPCVECVMQR